MLLGLSVVFFGQSFGKSEIHQHSFLSNSEKASNRPEIKSLNLSDLFDLADLKEAIEVMKDESGQYSVKLRTNPSGEKARDRLREAFEGVDILKELKAQLDQEVEVPVRDEAKNTIQEEKVPALGAVLAMALSVPSRDQFRGGRRLFFRDAQNLLTSVSPISQTLEPVDVIKANLKEIQVWSNQGVKKLRFTSKYGLYEPPQQILQWDDTQQRFSMETNEKNWNLWQGRKTAALFLENPEVKNELDQLKQELSSYPSEEVAAETFLSQDRVASRLYRGDTSDAHVGPILGKAVTKFLKSNNDPNHPESFSVAKRHLASREPIVSSQKPAKERVAFIYPDGNSSLRKNTARASGVGNIYNISRPSQAIPLIKKLFEETGKPIEVYFCSHGGPGQLVMANPSSSEIGLLTRETKGMVSGAYALGCSVGARAENLSQTHLLRELSVGWGVPVSAVDRTLYLDSFKWYSQSGAKLVTVSPNIQELDSKELIDQTPVWLLPHD